MATPRKHWFRVSDSLTRMPLSNDQLAALIRLMGALNTQWARDGLDADQATEIVLRPGDLAEVTGKGTPTSGRRVLQGLAEVFSISVEARGVHTRVRWPKWADFQRLTAPVPGKAGEKVSRESPPPQDARRKTQDSKSRGGKTRPSAPWSIRCSRVLIECLRPVRGAVIPAKAEETWAREIERLGRESPELASMPEDERERTVELAIRWLFGPENSGEYALVVRSGRALREKWPQIVAAAQRARARSKPQEDVEAWINSPGI